MKLVVVILLFLSTLSAEEYSHKGNIGFSYQYFSDKGEGKRDQVFDFVGEFESSYVKDVWSMKLLIDANIDHEDKERRYLTVNEAYLSYALSDADIKFGKEIRFWGALEAYNLADVFNSLDPRADPLDFQKLGAWNLSYTKYFESSEFSMIVKFYEENQPFASPDFPYYTPPNWAQYDEDLNTQYERYRPTFYINYGGSTDTTYPLDYAVMFQNGYDEKRGIMYNSASRMFQQYAYVVNRIATYNTLLVGDTLFKLEASFTDVDSCPRTKDYWQSGIGFEHTLYGIYNEVDIGLLAEYYHYDSDSDMQKLLQIFGSDLFIGARFTFNDKDDTSILAGIAIDDKYDEALFKIEFEKRLFDNYKIKADFLQTSPSDDATALKQLGKLTRTKLGVAYYF
ncbi:MAG: hypothetical protein K0U47_01060 [Epsilonproteobacteria bacterium]|nr:hypothetical protein [Campylobacterota bacterium]